MLLAKTHFCPVSRLAFQAFRGQVPPAPPDSFSSAQVTALSALASGLPFKFLPPDLFLQVVSSPWPSQAISSVRGVARSVTTSFNREVLANSFQSQESVATPLNDSDLGLGTGATSLGDIMSALAPGVT